MASINNVDEVLRETRSQDAKFRAFHHDETKTDNTCEPELGSDRKSWQHGCVGSVGILSFYGDIHCRHLPYTHSDLGLS
jgi:hypothetical protein